MLAILLIVVIEFINFRSIVIDESAPLVTYEAEEDIKNRYFENDIIVVFYEEQSPSLVLEADRLAVSDDGLIAVMSKQFLAVRDEDSLIWPRTNISIYNSQMEFQYGYYIYDSTSMYMKWSEKNLLVYFEKGSYVVELTPIGEVVDVSQYANNYYNSKYVREVIGASEVQVGDKTYRLSQNIFGKSSMLIETNADGSERIVYDARVMHAIMLTVTAGIILFVIVGFSVRIWKEKTGRVKKRLLWRENYK